jgi:hypothetical protein
MRKSLKWHPRIHLRIKTILVPSIAKLIVPRTHRISGPGILRHLSLIIPLLLRAVAPCSGPLSRGPALDIIVPPAAILPPKVAISPPEPPSSAIGVGGSPPAATGKVVLFS